MEHTHFTSGGVAERRLIYAMDAPDGMGQSESYDQPEKADLESMDSLLPNSEALAGDPDAEVTLEAAAVENTDAELEAPRKTFANAQAVLEGMQADSTEQTEDPTTKTLDVPVDTDASAELVEDATAPVPEEQLDVPSPSSEEMQDPETARLTGEIDLGIQELKEAKTPGEALAAIGKLFAAITEMIRRIFAKGEKQEADGGGTAEETAPGDLPKEPKAEQAPEEDERVRSADSLEKKKEALTVVGNESKETLENNHTAIKDIDTEIGTLEGQKTTLDEQIAELQSQIDSAEDTRGPAKRRILQTQLEGLKKQAASVQETIDAHTTHRNELVAENEALQKKIEAAEQAKDRVGFTLDAIHKVEQVLQEKFGIEAKTELNDGKATFVVDTLGESTPDWLRTFLQENDQNQNSDDGYQIDLDRAEWLSKAPQDAVPNGDEKEEQSSEFALDAVLKTVDAHVLDGNGRKESGDTAAASEHYAMGIAAIDQALSTLGEETSDYAARDQLNSRKAEIQGMIDALPSNVQPEVEPDTSDVASADADTQERSPEDLLAKRQEWAESIHQKSTAMKYPVVAVHAQEDGRIAMHFDTTQEGYVQKLERAAAYAKTRGIYSENIENVLMVDIAKKHETKGYFGEDFDQQAMDDFESKLDDEFAS